MKRFKMNEEGVVRLLIVLNLILFIYSYNTNVWRFDGSIESQGSYIPSFILYCVSILFNSIDDHITHSMINPKIVWGLSTCIVLDIFLLLTYRSIKWIKDGFEGRSSV